MHPKKMNWGMQALLRKAKAAEVCFGILVSRVTVSQARQGCRRLNG